mmetsp:Transcript_39010/g.116064  ORF Transcript_39010/g.116064 Transcript_39010/m.116064 type:complete len:84 (-) Transcript_39010:397-648(-)
MRRPPFLGMHACQLTRDLAGDVAALVIVLVALVLFETLATPQLYYIASAVMYQYSWPIQAWFRPSSSSFTSSCTGAPGASWRG